MNKSRIPAHPREVRRMKAVQRIVTAGGVSAIALAIIFGDSSRSLVNRLNMILIPTVIVLLGVAFHSLWRFRRACIEWQQERRIQ